MIETTIILPEDVLPAPGMLYRNGLGGLVTVVHASKYGVLYRHECGKDQMRSPGYFAMNYRYLGDPNDARRDIPTKETSK